MRVFGSHRTVSGSETIQKVNTSSTLTRLQFIFSLSEPHGNHVWLFMEVCSTTFSIHKYRLSTNFIFYKIYQI
jgi:hypothetical protein